MFSIFYGFVHLYTLPPIKESHPTMQFLRQPFIGVLFLGVLKQVHVPLYTNTSGPPPAKGNFLIFYITDVSQDYRRIASKARCFQSMHSALSISKNSNPVHRKSTTTLIDLVYDRIVVR